MKYTGRTYVFEHLRLNPVHQGGGKYKYTPAKVGEVRTVVSPVFNVEKMGMGMQRSETTHVALLNHNPGFLKEDGLRRNGQTYRILTVYPASGDEQGLWRVELVNDESI